VESFQTCCWTEPPAFAASPDWSPPSTNSPFPREVYVRALAGSLPRPLSAAIEGRWRNWDSRGCGPDCALPERKQASDQAFRSAGARQTGRGARHFSGDRRTRRRRIIGSLSRGRNPRDQGKSCGLRHRQRSGPVALRPRGPAETCFECSSKRRSGKPLCFCLRR